MTTVDGLLAEIIARPEDDAPRLIYADWLDEHGDPARAEFIRVQVALAKVASTTYTQWAEGGGPNECAHGIAAGLRCGECHAEPLRRRERELLAANFGPWTEGLPEPLVTGQCPHCVDRGPDWETGVVECRRCECVGLIPCADYLDFRRGFVAEVDCTVGDWIAHGPAVMRAQPVTRVTLSDRRPGGPSAILGTEYGRWWWERDERAACRDPLLFTLPGYVWWELTGYVHSDSRTRARGGPDQRFYPTEESALDALSAACLAYAQAAAYQSVS